MSASDHVSITINTTSVNPTFAGFGRLNVVSHNAPFGERYRIYTDTAGMITDGFAADSPEVLAVAAALSQDSKPEDVMVSSALLQPTQVYTMSIASVMNNHTYELVVSGEGVTGETVSYTSDATATDGEIAAGLVAALQAVVGKNYTAAGATSPFTATGDAAADWFSISSPRPAEVSIRQTHADPGIATDLAAIALATSEGGAEWYWMVTLFNSQALMTAASNWAQSNRKLYAADSNDSRDRTTVSDDTSGIFDIIQALGNYYTFPLYHRRPASFIGAGMAGNLGSRNIGSWTAKFKRPVGAEAENLTTTERANLISRHANFVETVKGLTFLSEGTTSAGPTVTRGFVDNVVNLDYAEDRYQTAVLATLAAGGKLPRDDRGMVKFDNALQGVNSLLVRKTIATADPAPYTTIPKVADMDPALAPRGVEGAATFTLAGAAHTASVTVNVLEQ